MYRLAGSRAAAAAATMAAVAGPWLVYSSTWRPAFTGSDVTATPATALDPAEFKKFKLAAVEHLSHDTKRYTFALPSPSQELGLAVASFLLVRGPGPDGKPAIRPYTPTTPVHARGQFDLVIKAYPTGVISKYLDGLTPGAEVEMKGPISKFAYVANTWDAVGLIAGGSGITPMYQLIQEILSNPRDRTEIRLIYANRSPEDILLKKQLDALAVVHPQFKVMYTVDNPTPEWKGRVGHITPEMVASFLPPPPTADGPKHKVFVCGPPGMMRHVSGEKKSPADQGDLTGLLAGLKYTKDAVFKY